MENSNEVIVISKISEKRRVLSLVGDKAVAKLKSKYLNNMNFYELQYLLLKSEEAVIQFSIIYRISIMKHKYVRKYADAISTFAMLDQ